MRHILPLSPQFYVTAPQPCPYLDDRMERKLFTALNGPDAEVLNDALSKQGFRRSQNVLYRPSCAECNACLSARIKVADFTPSRSQRRVLRRNARLERRVASAWVHDDHYALFRDYLDARHAAGGMADMDFMEFAAMVEETPVTTRLVEYLRPADAVRDEVLRAVALTDVLGDGLSMVYSFFAPHRERDSLGTHLILDHVALAREMGLPYVYLGYWVPGSPKMDYKARFTGLEIYYGGVWTPLEDPQAFDAALHPLSTDPIAEQVARIALPGRRKVD